MASRGGETFDEARDGARLNQQHKDVLNHVKDGNWYSLQGISEATGHPPASVSARLRDFRKTKYGGHTVNRKYVSNGLFIYQFVEAPAK